MSEVTWFTTGKTSRHKKFSQLKFDSLVWEVPLKCLGNLRQFEFEFWNPNFSNKATRYNGMSLKCKLWAGERQVLWAHCTWASSRPCLKRWVAPEG